MTLKQQSILVSFGSTLFMVCAIGVMFYGRVLSDFQLIENQRVERSLKSLQFALQDKQKQLEAKISDWAMWDDTYDFIINKNPAYIESNLTQETFQKLGVHHVLYINVSGGLIEQVGDSQDLYHHFATGSAIIQSFSDEVHQSGVIRTSEGLFIFSAESILKSDGSGPPRGVLVFTQAFDKEVVNSLHELTQSNVKFEAWNTFMSPDFKKAKNKISLNSPTTIEIGNEKIISGYLLLNDVYTNPQGIIRIDSSRDIILQGKANMYTLMLILLMSGLLGAVIQYWLMNSIVLKGIVSIALELKEMGKIKSLSQRLQVGVDNNELEALRININSMLSDIEQSQKLLKKEVGARESLVELIDSVVVMLDNSSKIIMVNKRGTEILGYTHEEMIGKDWINLMIIPEEQEMIRRKFQDLIQTQTQNNTYVENSIRTKEGAVLIYGWHNTIVRDSDNSVVSTLSVGNDITIIKKEEKEKEDYTNTLKQMNDVMIGREMKMIELKKRIAELEQK